MDRFVLRGSSSRAAPQSNEKEEQVVVLQKAKTTRKRKVGPATSKAKVQAPLKQDVAISNKENQQRNQETLNIETPFPDDLEDIGSQLVVWKDNTTNIPPYCSSPNSKEYVKEETAKFTKAQAMERDTCHENTQDLGFSSPELFQFWKRHGVSRLKRNKNRKNIHFMQEQVIENEYKGLGDEIGIILNKPDTLSNKMPYDSSGVEHREETISSLLEESCEELSPDIVLSLEEWFRKYEQQLGPSQASSERLRVVTVQDNQTNRTKLLHLSEVNDERKSVSVLLCDLWYNTNVCQGDIVRIVLVDEHNVFQSFPKKFSDDWQISMDERQNFLILHPDTLISATCLSNSFTCMRRTVLADWNRFAGVDSISALEGAMIHSLVEAGLVFVSKMNNTEEKNGSLIASLYSVLMEKVNSIVNAELENLYGLSADDQDIRSSLEAFVPQIVKWLEHNIIRPDPNSSMECFGMGNTRNTRVRLHKAESVEETIWSPVWGLKGKIDALVQIEIENNQIQQVPFELKTITERHSQAPTIAHRAQLLLYFLLLSDRNDQSCDKGLLNYFVRESQSKSKSSTQRTVLVASIRAELVGLVMTRNELVRYVSYEQESMFPPLLKYSERICQKCSAASNCMILHKLLENGSEETARQGPGVELFTQYTRHLTQNHAQYFQYWFRILCKEEKLVQQTRQEIWTLGWEERENQGNCFGHLILVSDEESTISENKTGYWKHMFQKKQPSQSFSFLGSNIVLGDYIVVSGQTKSHWKVGLARGFICSLTESSVVTQLDCDLSTRQSTNRFDEWRIDKDEMVSGWAIVKINLQSLFLPEESEGCPKLRNLIVDLQPPQLDRQITVDFSQYDVFRKLNEEQQAGIVKAFQSLDYMLVHGMPGTGKTAWIVALVEIAVRQGLDVLLCGHTHNSVDNILLRLKQRNVSFLRLGRYDLIHNQLWDYCLYSPSGPKPKTVKEWKQVLESPRVVATTCMGVSHVVFSKRRFDLVGWCRIYFPFGLAHFVIVVDEAGQIAEPVCIGPLRMAKRSFVLVGDPYQLPPLMRVSKWKDSVQSLFERLCLEHPEATITLCKQYRMANDIMQLCNQLVYSQQLQCADEQVASKCLAISTDAIVSYPEWLRRCVDSQARVVFLDTDALPAREVRNNQLLSVEETKHSDVSRSSIIHWNPQEAALIVQLVSTLHQSGLCLEDIGIISPYRAQCSYLRHLMSPWSHQLEIKTVDQFQGRDKPCIILSFVRSNDEKRVGSLLRDWRRINVAFTRAQSKCIFVGSLSTLEQGCPFLAKFTSLLQQHQWIVSVPKEQATITTTPPFLNNCTNLQHK